MRHARLWAIALAVVVGFALQQQARGGAVYWTNGGAIYRANLDGSGETQIVRGFATGLTLDLVQRQVYYIGDLPIESVGESPIRSIGPNARIWRANLDGSGQETLVSLWTSPNGIALQPGQGNLAARKMYWTDSTSIQRTDLDGGRPELLVDRLSAPQGIALDPERGKMYWTRDTVDEKIAVVQRANLDGSGVEDVVGSLPGPSSGIALDLAGGRMYFGYIDPYIDSIYAGMIKSAKLDGSDVQTIVAGLVQPEGVAWDPVQKKVYWIDGAWIGGSGRIYRADADGKESEMIAQNLILPRGLAVDPTVPEPGMLVGLGVAGLLMVGRRRH